MALQNDSIVSYKKKMRALLFDAKMPKHFWDYAVGFAVHVYNKTPRVSLKFKTPFEILHKRPSTVKHVRRFGCLALEKIPKQLIDSKFSPRGKETFLIGCTETG